MKKKCLEIISVAVLAFILLSVPSNQIYDSPELSTATSGKALIGSGDAVEGILGESNFGPKGVAKSCLFETYLGHNFAYVVIPVGREVKYSIAACRRELQRAYALAPGNLPIPSVTPSETSNPDYDSPNSSSANACYAVPVAPVGTGDNSANDGDGEPGPNSPTSSDYYADIIFWIK